MARRGPDRDLRALGLVARQGARRQKCAPASAGVLRRFAGPSHASFSMDDPRLDVVPGRYVPLGYARYESPVIDPADFEFYLIAGARVAVPRSTPGCRAAELLQRFYVYGPESVGYVVLGDTYVPAILSPGDRAALAGATPRVRF